MIGTLQRCLLIGALAVGSVTIMSCGNTAPGKHRGGASVHFGYGASPFGRYAGYYPVPIPVPPDVVPPTPGLPIEPPIGGGGPPEAVPLPLPEPDFGGGWGGGDFDFGDF